MEPCIQSRTQHVCRGPRIHAQAPIEAADPRSIGVIRRVSSWHDPGRQGGRSPEELLKARGAHVIGIASDANHPWLESVGVVPLDYSSPRFANDSLRLPMLAERISSVAPLGVVRLIDTHGAEYLQLGLELGITRERIETARRLRLQVSSARRRMVHIWQRALPSGRGDRPSCWGRDCDSDRRVLSPARGPAGRCRTGQAPRQRKDRPDPLSRPDGLDASI